MNCVDCSKEVKGRTRCPTCYSRHWRKNNPEKAKAGRQDWYERNKEKEIIKAQKWNKANLQKANASNRKYVKNSNYYVERYQNDVNFRLKVILRSRLLQSINTNAKSGSAVTDLGCSIDELKKYLESKFQPGMTWENIGEWHIDHVKPLSQFDLTIREQFLEACHYTNLQPLWAADNLKKSDQVQ